MTGLQLYNMCSAFCTAKGITKVAFSKALGRYSTWLANLHCRPNAVIEHTTVRAAQRYIRDNS